MSLGVRSSEVTGAGVALSPRGDRLALKVALVGAGVCVAAWIVDGWTSAAALSLVTICVVQGVRLGAAVLLGVVAGSAVAMVLAPSIGGVAAPWFNTVTGASGLVGRIVCIAIVGACIIAIGGCAGRLARARYLRGDARAARHDSIVGGALGLVEGGILAVGLMWVLFSLQPVARARLEAASPGSSADAARYVRRGDGLARLVAQAAVELGETLLGRLARSTNPIEGVRMISLAEAFAAVSRDHGALEYFVNTEAMKRLRELPSYQEGIERAQSDPDLSAFFVADGVPSDALLRLMSSDAVLRILDETTIAADIEPLAGDLERALLDARSRVGMASSSPDVRPDDIVEHAVIEREMMDGQRRASEPPSGDR
jgi:hypothetical protein